MNGVGSERSNVTSSLYVTGKLIGNTSFMSMGVFPVVDPTMHLKKSSKTYENKTFSDKSTDWDCRIVYKK
jgi:hypothetical protein